MKNQQMDNDSTNKNHRVSMSLMMKLMVVVVIMAMAGLAWMAFSNRSTTMGSLPPNCTLHAQLTHAELFESYAASHVATSSHELTLVNRSHLKSIEFGVTLASHSHLHATVTALSLQEHHSIQIA